MGSTKQIEMMPIAEIPDHQESFRMRAGTGCINIDSLQLFTPRGMNLFGPPQPQNADEIRVQEIIEEEYKEDEEDITNHYNPRRQYIYQENKIQRPITAENN